MKRRLMIAGAVAGVILPILAADVALATKAISEEQGLACTVCHDKPGSKMMTDQGKYWELMGSFEGYDGLKASFGKCTTCHVREPGSATLTATGEKYRSVIQEMDDQGLRDWLMQPHPVAPEEPTGDADGDR